MGFVVLGSREFVERLNGLEDYRGALVIDKKDDIFTIDLNKMPEDITKIFIEFSWRFSKFHSFLNNNINLFDKYEMKIIEPNDLDIISTYFKLINDYQNIADLTMGYLSFYDVTAIIILILHKIKSDNLENVKALEIGSWTGFSSYFIAKSLNTYSANNVLFCIDTWGDGEAVSKPRGSFSDYVDVLHIFRSLMKGLGISNNIKTMAMNSNTAFEIMKDDSFDVIFIDGDHRYDFIFSDIINSLLKIKVGGLIFGHDFRHYDGIFENPPIDILESCKNEPITYFQGREYEIGVIVAVREIFGNSFTCIPNSSVWFKVVTEDDKKLARRLINYKR